MPMDTREEKTERMNKSMSNYGLKDKRFVANFKTESFKIYSMPILYLVLMIHIIACAFFPAWFILFSLILLQAVITSSYET